MHQGGYEMLTALASSGCSWLNVRSMTPLRHAKSLLEWYGKPDAGFLSGAGAAFLVEKLLQESSLPTSSPIRRASRAVAATIRELRVANVTPDRYEETGDASYGRSISQIYRQYTSYLNENAMLDEAAVFKRATETMLDDDSLDLPNLIMILDEVVLTSASLAYVRAIGRRARKAYRIGYPLHESGLPSHSAGRLLSDWPVYGFDDSGSCEKVGVEFVPTCTFETRSAVGADNEIRSTFQTIVGDELRLDSVEIAYTAHDPYLRVIRSLASRYAIPVTFAAGVPAFSTRTGQAIKHFIEWILDGHSSRGLLDMLRAGLIDLGNSAIDAQPIATAAADSLATVRIGQGTVRYGFVFDNQQRSLLEAAERARGTFMEDTATAALRKHDELVFALKPLLELANLSGKTRLAELAGRMERLLTRFVHRPDVAAKVAAEVSAEVSAEVAENVAANESSRDDGISDEADIERIAARDLITRLNQLGEQIREAIPLTPLLAHVLEMLSNAFVRARAAAPGSVHVVPLSSAGYTGRDNLFIVGMDELTMGRAGGEDPLLTDVQRQNLKSEYGHGLTLSSDVSHRQSWHFDRAVSKVLGKVTLLYSRYDVADDRELYPSSVFLRIRSQSATELNDEAPATYVSSVDSESEIFPLDLTDVSLRARKTPEARSWLSGHYPWMEKGRVALDNRASAQWTLFDGQLGIETGALNPFRGKSRLSASRLETLINCPFKYFLKYILKARAPEEAEEDVWLDALERGSLIHRALARYMSERGHGSISEDDIAVLENVLFSELEGYAASRSAPNPAVEHAIRTELSAVARAFIADEKERQSIAEPLAFEFGFGLWPHMKKEEPDRTDPVTIDLNGLHVPLLGWVDRIDKARGGGIFITDYKTGSSNGYDPADLLNDGRSLQWALYAYVIEQLLGEPVVRSGYLFPGSRELGRRIEADPSAVRNEIADHLRRMGRMAQSGAFFQAADDTGACRYCDFRRVCGDISSVKRNVRSKMGETTPATPQYELLNGWHYAQKKLRGNN